MLICAQDAQYSNSHEKQHFILTISHWYMTIQYYSTLLKPCVKPANCRKIYFSGSLAYICRLMTSCHIFLTKQLQVFFLPVKPKNVKNKKNQTKKSKQKKHQTKITPTQNSDILLTFFIYDIWNIFNRDFQTQTNSGRFYNTGLQTLIKIEIDYNSH